MSSKRVTLSDNSQALVSPCVGGWTVEGLTLPHLKSEYCFSLTADGQDYTDIVRYDRNGRVVRNLRLWGETYERLLDNAREAVVRYCLDEE